MTMPAWLAASPRVANVEAQEARLASAKKSNPGDMTAWHLVWKVFAKILYEYLVSKKLSQAGIEPAT
jgi:hypothetical protein